MHLYVSKLCYNRFRWWLVVCSVPCHYLNQCWVIVSWTLGNKFQWNLLNETESSPFKKICLKMSPKWRPFCIGLNVLNRGLLAQSLATVFIIILVFTSPRPLQWQATVTPGPSLLTWNNYNPGMGIYLRVYSLHHNVLPTLQPNPLLANGPLYRSHRIPPATTRIQYLETHADFP